ncbi:MAG: metallophosphoesterase [Oscillospiraceae bacterium]|nr:metallophosphoesterase [Oscillospiraceae bacterium]
MKCYFIADTHFGDERIRKYENRPFPTTDLMDQVLIHNWNARVAPEDTVYILGDFGADGDETQVLAQLNGTKFLIKGNHDTKSNAAYRNAGFQEVYDHPIILDGFWLLSHEALYVNSNMPYANLFGHVHNSPIVCDYSSQHFCVCVERIGYAPISFDEIKKKIQEASES